MTSCQVDLSSGLIPRNLVIQDDDEDEIPEEPEPDQAKTDKATPAPEQDKALGQKKSSGGPAPCPSKGKAKSAPERTRVVDKRVARSQGSAEELVLPISKRARSKSKSPLRPVMLERANQRGSRKRVCLVLVIRYPL